MRLTAEFYVRGGIYTTVVASPGPGLAAPARSNCPEGRPGGRDAATFSLFSTICRFRADDLYSVGCAGIIPRPFRQTAAGSCFQEALNGRQETCGKPKAAKPAASKSAARKSAAAKSAAAKSSLNKHRKPAATARPAKPVKAAPARKAAARRGKNAARRQDVARRRPSQGPRLAPMKRSGAPCKAARRIPSCSTSKVASASLPLPLAAPHVRKPAA